MGVDDGGLVDRKSYPSPFKFSDQLNSVRFDLASADLKQKPAVDESEFED